MTHISIWPYFFIMVLVLFTCSIILGKNKFYELQLVDDSKKRLQALDGLRGYLAMGVFFHHGLIMYYYYVNDSWQVPPSAFYTLLGEVAVALFFMVTGFLFWEKIMSGGLNLRKFAVSRIRRIVPLYMFSVFCVFAVVLVLSGFSLNVSGLTLLEQAIQWSSFSFLGTPDINGVADTFIIESIYWTLKWEWIFYFLLPVMAVFSKRPFVIISVLFAYCLICSNIHFLNFTLGIFAATVLRYIDVKRSVRNLFYILSTSGLLALFLIFDTGYGVVQSLLMGAFFVSVIHGNTLLGLLTSRPACLLGLVSYSIYLMHNIVTFIVFRILDVNVASVAMLSPVEFWGIMAVTALLVLFCSLITFRYIEYQFNAGIRKVNFCENSGIEVCVVTE